MNRLMWILAAAGVLLSFLMSGMEAGLFALNRLRIRRLARAGSGAARRLSRLLEQSDEFLWTILVGNTIASFGIATLVLVTFRELRGAEPVAFWVTFIAGCVAFYAVCDLFPKMLFRLYPNRLCMWMSAPFTVVAGVLRPLVWLASWLARARWSAGSGRRLAGHMFGSREELRHLMQESAQNLSTEERGMINRVLDLQHQTVAAVTRPLDKVISVTTRTPLPEVLRLSQERNLSRLPVWQEDGAGRRIAGVINVRLLLFAGEADPGLTAGDRMRPAMFLDEDLRLEDALRQLQRGGQRLAVVLGRDRREVGIVSLQDMLQAVFGRVRL